MVSFKNIQTNKTDENEFIILKINDRLIKAE